MQGTTLERAHAARQEAELRFQHLPTLAGIGLAPVGTGYGVKLNLSAPLGEGHPALPTEIGGVPLIVSVVGQIKKL